MYISQIWITYISVPISFLFLFGCLIVVFVVLTCFKAFIECWKAYVEEIVEALDIFLQRGFSVFVFPTCI